MELGNTVSGLSLLAGGTIPPGGKTNQATDSIPVEASCPAWPVVFCKLNVFPEICETAIDRAGSIKFSVEVDVLEDEDEELEALEVLETPSAKTANGQNAKAPTAIAAKIARLRRITATFLLEWNLISTATEPGPASIFANPRARGAWRPSFAHSLTYSLTHSLASPSLVADQRLGSSMMLVHSIRPAFERRATRNSPCGDGIERGRLDWVRTNALRPTGSWVGKGGVIGSGSVGIGWVGIGRKTKPTKFARSFVARPLVNGRREIGKRSRRFGRTPRRTRMEEK